MRVAIHLLTLCLSLSLLACATPTETYSTWQTRTSEAKPTFSHLYVLAMSEKAANAAVVEKEIRHNLEKEGIRVTLGSETLGSVDRASDGFREAVTAEVQQSGADGVMVVTLLKIEERDEYVPPQVDYTPAYNAHVYLGYAPYVGHHSTLLYQPGYYYNARDYYLQTQLYSIASKKPVWQAQSRTMNPDTLARGAQGFARSMVEALSDDGAFTDEK